MYLNPSIVGKARSTQVTDSIDILIWECSPIERNLGTIKMNDERLQLAYAQCEFYRLLVLFLDIIIVSMANTPKHLCEYLTNRCVEDPGLESHKPRFLPQPRSLCFVFLGSTGIFCVKQILKGFLHAVHYPVLALFGESFALPSVKSQQGIYLEKDGRTSLPWPYIFSFLIDFR